MDNHELAEIVMEKMWAMIGDKRLSGLSPYQAARKFGLLDAPAKLVDELWDGPRPLP
jgi:hypothetical protein